MNGLTYASCSACRWIASMIRRSPCPALTHISWLLKSMNRRPSAVSKWTPLALTTGRGLRPACADQSYSVWRRQSSVISCALRALTASITIRVSRPHSSGHLRALGGRAPDHPTKSAISRGPRWALKPASRGPALPRHASAMHSSSRHPFLGSGRRSSRICGGNRRRDTRLSLVEHPDSVLRRDSRVRPPARLDGALHRLAVDGDQSEVARVP